MNLHRTPVRKEAWLRLHKKISQPQPAQLLCLVPLGPAIAADPKLTHPRYTLGTEHPSICDSGPRTPRKSSCWSFFIVFHGHCTDGDEHSRSMSYVSFVFVAAFENMGSPSLTRRAEKQRVGKRCPFMLGFTQVGIATNFPNLNTCLLYTSPSPRDA